MFEIDSVQRAIEAGASFEVVDNVSDAYFDAVELATRSRLDEEDIARFQRLREVINNHETYIFYLLEREQAILDLLNEKRSLKEAYVDTLEQADSIVAAS